MPRRDTRAIEDAVALALASPNWAAADSDAARAIILADAVLAALAANSLTDAHARAHRNRLIRDAFDGSNYDALARRYGLSVRQVRRVVHPGRR